MPADLARLTTELAASDVARRSAAADTASRLGDEARPLALALVRATGDADESVREGVIAALEDLGPPRAEDASNLAALLEDPCAAVGYWSATLLGRLGAAAGPQVAALADAMAKGADLSVRERAAWALGEIGPGAAAAREALEQAAESGGRLARLATTAIEKLSP